MRSSAGGLGVIPPLAAPLPALPTDKAGIQAIQRQQAAPIAEAKVIPQGEWKIQRIWGQGNVMQAQLVKGDVIANIKKGDTLPTGEKIVELSGKGVTLHDGKTQSDLGWLEDTKAHTGS
jgi:hypothetical protein